MLTLLILLLLAHALADFPLQGDFLAKAKHGSVPLVPAWYALAIHSLIHAGLVLLVTESLLLFTVEFVAHWAIDKAKIKCLLSFGADQALHVMLKVLYVPVFYALYV